MKTKPLKRQKLFIRSDVECKPLEPVKIINMRVTKPWKPWHVKGDRSTPIGNPFWRGESSRDWCCDEYQKMFDACMQNSDSTIYQHMMKLLALYWKYGKLDLYCWCAPKRCHMETIKQWLEEQSDV